MLRVVVDVVEVRGVQKGVSSKEYHPHRVDADGQGAKCD